MANDYCYGILCFVPLDANAPKFFGFPEFLAGLALMVLAWTIADVRYRFRVKTAPLPLQGITFAVVGAIGILTLLTDLWRAEQWLVPSGNILTPAEWQAVLGGMFLLTFLAWTWFAFIRPPVYGKRNAKRYAQALYQAILKGSPSELSVVADEFASSAKSLIHSATDKTELNNYAKTEPHQKRALKKQPEVTAYANDILLLIADKRFCRAIIESSTGTALAIFREIGETKKYGVNVEIFARNLVNEALANNDSFLFHETEGYESGLIGYHKPLSQTMFSNYAMVEVIGTLFDPTLPGGRNWHSAQWKAYCRIVLMTIRDYVDNNLWNHSFVLHRAMGFIERAAFDIYKIDGGTSGAWNSDELAKLEVVIDFIEEAVDVLDKKGVPQYLPLRIRENRIGRTFYDSIADMIFEVIFAASNVRAPSGTCWMVQHNSVWSKLFGFTSKKGAAAKVVKFKVRRLIYDEVAGMKRIPNFKGAPILGFCLNVMGLTVDEHDYSRDSKALQKAILSWTKKNYAWLNSDSPQVAEACLINGITYDATHTRLVKTYPANGLMREPEHIYLNLDPPPPAVETLQENG